MHAGSPDRVQRRLAAILAADVVGYSRLMEADEAGTARLLREHRAATDPLVSEHGGRIVKTTGDGVLIEFPSVVGAVQCAVAFQKLMGERNAEFPSERRMEWRVGIHLGDILIDGEDILGDGVNLAARLEGIAEPGGICISEDAFRQVRGKIETEFLDSGEQALKNIARPVRIYRSWPASAPVSLVSTATALPLPDKPSIAVLPFQNMSGDPQQEYFADGMVEEITTAISRFPWLFVIARNSSFTYKGHAVNVKQVGRELGVRYVLEGSVRKAGNRVRIGGQLIDTATGAHIWADRFDGALDDVFELQDQVASGVIGAIEPRLLLAEIDRANRKPTESLDAYDLYLRATAEANKRTKEGHAEATRLARQALELDPAYAPAMTRLASCRLMQLARSWIPASGPEVEEGVRMARQAITAGRDDSELLQNAGYALGYLAGENETALDALDRAIVLNPNAAAAFGQRALVLSWINRSEEAILSAQQAIRLSPQHPSVFASYTALAAAHMAAGRDEEALLWADRALRENSGAVALRLKLSLCGHLGRIKEATQCLHLLQQIHSEPTIAGVMRGVSKGLSPECTAKLAEGLRKAGLPE